MWLLKLIATGAIKLAGKVGLSGLFKTGLSIAFPGLGTLATMALEAGQAVLAFVYDQARKTIGDCVKNPRVFIAIGVALAAGNWYGWGNGYKQGEGDLETYRQEAVIYQKQADETADAAKIAKEQAKKAEAAKIAAERAKAEADKKVASASTELVAAKAKADAAEKKTAAANRQRSVCIRKSKNSGYGQTWLGSMFGT